jgi:hypothetical protein
MFIFLQTDSFERKSQVFGAGTRNQQALGNKDKEGKSTAEFAAIRRPYRGLQIKNDTYAVISVRRPDGTPITLFSSSAVPSSDSDAKAFEGGVWEYSDFILQQVNDQRVERQQIIETFGDTFIYFFGERPRMVTFSGLLMNTEDFNWRAQFWENYEKFFRGSKLVQSNARMYLAYDTIVLEGYPISAVAVDDATNPYQVSFSVTMFMTDYHEYSVIGQTTFPNSPLDKSTEVLNQELASERKKFVSTTVAVRRENTYSTMSNQLPRTNSALAILRSGVQAWNSASTWLGDKLATANRMLGGRTLRMPIGAASFLTLMNEAEINAASTTVLSTGSSSFDVVTGRRFGTVVVNGVTIPGNKLQVMAPSKFGPSWVSAVTGLSRGMIYENYDEYPNRTQPSSLASFFLNGNSDYTRIMKAGENRVKNMTAFDESLRLFNTVAAQGGVLGAIAEVVSAVRMGYGMLLTGANLVRDPMNTLGAAVGVTPQDVTRIGEGLKDGAFIPGVSMFVGGAARRTWANWINDVRTANIGDTFNTFEYQSNVGRAAPILDPFSQAPNRVSSLNARSPGYDMAYGESDYTALIAAQSAIDAQTAAAEGDLPVGVTRTEPNAGKIESALSEAYGDTDSTEYGTNREDPTTLDTVYGRGGTIVRTRPSAEERAKMLQEAYNGDAPPNDTDVVGITAVDADSAPIDPVI